MKNRKSNYIVYTVIILAMTLYAFLTGCGNSPNGNPIGSSYSNGSGESGGSTTPQTINLNITNEGKVVRTSSPSGRMTVEAPEANTYSSEVVLKITESPSVGNESDLLTVGSKIYAITATRDGQPINLLSHPLNLTFSNEEKLKYKEFFKESDMLVLDSQYTIDELYDKPNWGHSTCCHGVELALECNIKKLYLFHHEPTYDDKKINSLLKIAKWYADSTGKPSFEIKAATEGMDVLL